MHPVRDGGDCACALNRVVIYSTVRVQLVVLYSINRQPRADELVALLRRNMTTLEGVTMGMGMASRTISGLSRDYHRATTGTIASYLLS